MEHHHLARPTALDPAAVIERLEADLGHADRVGVVAVLGEGVSGEPRPQELHAPDRPTAAQPLPGAARTFKTLTARPR
jgi:hypothetical protein